VPSVKEDPEQRYARQLGVPGWGADGQRRLSESHVFIAGAGGLGSAASIYLAAAGVGKLTICDTDRVDLSNLNRQILYTSQDIGHEKAPTAAARLRALNPGIDIVPITREITPASACDLVRGANLILDCLDNLETRFALNRCCVATGIPMVYAAVSEFTGHLSFLHPPATPCLECFVSRTPPPTEPAIPGCTAGSIGAIQAMEAVKFLTGIGENLTGRLLVIEGAELRFDVVTIEKDPTCPACGHPRR
jgi:molybdopterin/thiamine biosynthesis adenylyltransferase